MTASLADNVWDFVLRASELVGQFEERGFAQEMQANCLELGMQSPI